MRYNASTEEEELGPDDLRIGGLCGCVFGKITEKEEFFGGGNARAEATVISQLP